MVLFEIRLRRFRDFSKHAPCVKMEAFFPPHGTNIVLVRLFGFQGPRVRIFVAVAFSGRPESNSRLMLYVVIVQLCELTRTSRRACFRCVRTVFGVMRNRDGTCAAGAPQHVDFSRADVRVTTLCRRVCHCLRFLAMSCDTCVW